MLVTDLDFQISTLLNEKGPNIFPNHSKTVLVKSKKTQASPASPYSLNKAAEKMC